MSRNRARSASAGLDNRAFREAIANMRQENLEAKAETQRVKDQLNCLIMLVRRAWMGDEVAAVHVSNIVGVAPPSLHQSADNGQVHANFKTKAVHHWAMLSIGLLNRYYRQLEEQSLARSKARLQQRQDFLDDQLIQHRQVIRNTQRINKSRLDSKHAELIKSMERLGEKRTSHSYVSEALPAQTMLEFLYPGKEFEVVRDPKSRVSSASSTSKSRYMKPGLFDVQGVVSEKPKSRRPYSAHQILQKADSLHKTATQRMRPKSAVTPVPVIKGDRPLKYETTRPVKGKHEKPTSKQSPFHNSQPKSETSHNQHSKSESSYNHYSEPVFRTEPKDDITLLDDDTSMEILKDQSHVMPRSMADSVTEELRKIAQMEDEFRRTTKMLQSKLGISGNGTV